MLELWSLGIDSGMGGSYFSGDIFCFFIFIFIFLSCWLQNPLKQVHERDEGLENELKERDAKKAKVRVFSFVNLYSSLRCIHITLLNPPTLVSFNYCLTSRCCPCFIRLICSIYLFQFLQSRTSIRFVSSIELQTLLFFCHFEMPYMLLELYSQSSFLPVLSSLAYSVYLCWYPGCRAVTKMESISDTHFSRTGEVTIVRHLNSW